MEMTPIGGQHLTMECLLQLIHAKKVLDQQQRQLVLRQYTSQTGVVMEAYLTGTLILSVGMSLIPLLTKSHVIGAELKIILKNQKSR